MRKSDAPTGQDQRRLTQAKQRGRNLSRVDPDLR